ncbi:GGDEF domain-containing protein [Duganella sp. PWIR1]
MKDNLLHDAFGSLNLGVLVVDARYRITLWNVWLAAHTGRSAAEALGQDFFEVFPDLQHHRVGVAIHQAICHNLPSLLSQSLHRSPFPLFADPAEPGQRISQAITITPLGGDERHCMIQINDVSTAVRREALLREQAHVLLSQSLSDGLTGVGNRRHFDLCLDKEWRAAKRNGKPLSLLMIDVDFFKPYNDHYGHQQGDLCLQLVAAAMRKALRRPEDMLFRYGGEEFCALLPGTRPADAIEVAESVRASVLALRLPQVRSADGDMVSVSVGVANYGPRAQLGHAQLVLAADSALYEAKRAGRNRVRANAAF